MVLSQPFTTSNGAIASYSFSDLVQQVSYGTYYGASVNSNYVLSPQTIASTDIQTTDTSNNSSKAGTPDFDLDFDLTDNDLSQSIKGIAMVTIPFNVNITGGAGEQNNIEVEVFIRKWDGATETEIADGTTGVVSVNTSSTGVRNGVATAFIEIPRTHLAQGEQLRVTLQAYVWHSVSYNINWEIGHSPDGSIGDDFRSSNFTTGDPVQMIVQIPYEVDR